MIKKLKTPLVQFLLGSIVFVALFAVLETVAKGVIIWKILLAIPCFIFQFWCIRRMQLEEQNAQNRRALILQTILDQNKSDPSKLTLIMAQALNKQIKR